MRFAVHLRADLKERLNVLAGEMSAWDGSVRVGEVEAQQIRERVTFFEHTTHRPGLTLAGVDGSGDYPALSYGDSFVYVTVAQGTLYTSDPHSGLKELPCPGTELLDFCWIPEDEVQRFESIDQPAHSVRERFVRGVHAGKERVATGGRYLDCV